MANSFTLVSSGGVSIWRGNPGCQNGHDAILAWLRETVDHFLSAAQAKAGGNILRGNLGESIAFCVSLWYDCQGHRAHAVNAWRPLSPQSVQDIDIVWVFFGSKAKEDFAIVQEVKTTSGKILTYADQLITDYEKLYGVNLDLTLRSRFKPLKKDFLFKVGGRRGKELSDRLIALVGGGPDKSPQIRLRPTLVHELTGAEPRSKMTWIRNTLIGKGWPATTVEAWAIGLGALDARLLRLATGTN
jgi:hypothetical protein